MPKKETTKVIAKNRRAFHDYEILQTYEAGIVLTGTEVCSLRENNCQLTDCFALIRKGEVWVNNLQAPSSSQRDSRFGAQDAGKGHGIGASQDLF